MKKITILLLSLMFVFAINAQTTKYASSKQKGVTNKTQTVNNHNIGTKTDIFSEGFETGIPATWTNIDSDGDTYKWSVMPAFRAHSGDSCVASASWVSQAVGAVTPSNWLITPEISLPAGATIKLEYWVSGQDQDYPEEHYGLLLSPTASVDTASFTVSLVDETITAGNGTENDYFKRTAILSSYAGTSIRLAWKHFNITDQFYINIDDIRIFEPLSVDAEIVGLTLPSNLCDLSANTEVTISVRNNGLTAINNVPVSFVKGASGTPVTGTIATINPDQTVEYTFTTGADFSQAGVLDSVQATVALPGDLLASNDKSEWISSMKVDPSDIPYTQDFENEANLLGWSIEDGNNDGASWYLDESITEAHGGSIYANIDWNVDEALNDWLISKCINITPGDYVMTYWYRVASDSYPENLKVAYGTSPTATALTNTIDNHAGFTDTVYVQGFAPFTISTAGVYYFGFNAYSDADMYRIFLDDISIVVDTKISETTLTSKIYPNPASSNIRIESNSIIKMVRIVNVLGQEVFSQATANRGLEVNVSNLNDGVYFVTIETANGTKTSKINIIK